MTTQCNTEMQNHYTPDAKTVQTRVVAIPEVLICVGVVAAVIKSIALTLKCARVLKLDHCTIYWLAYKGCLCWKI